MPFWLAPVSRLLTRRRGHDKIFRMITKIRVRGEISDAGRQSSPESAPAAVRAVARVPSWSRISAAAASNWSRTAAGRAASAANRPAGQGLPPRRALRPAAAPRQAGHPGPLACRESAGPCAPDKRNYRAYTEAELFTAPFTGAALIARAVQTPRRFAADWARPVRRRGAAGEQAGALRERADGG